MVGLVLEGGAMRGMYTNGVLDVFMDHQIAVDQIVGVSAGALFGVNFLSEQRGRPIRYSKRFNRDRSYLGMLPLLREGNIVSTEYAYHRVPCELDPFDNETYTASTVPFYAVVTNTETGMPEYLRVTDVFKQMDTLRASGSMPFVSRAVPIGDQYYLDGAITDSIPFEWMAEQGCEKLIVVLTQDIHYKKESMAAIAPLYRLKYPQIARALKLRHIIYNESTKRLRQWEQEGKAFVIRPSAAVKIGRTEKNPEKLQQIYELGVRDAEAQMAALHDYLAR